MKASVLPAFWFSYLFSFIFRQAFSHTIICFFSVAVQRQIAAPPVRQQGKAGKESPPDKSAASLNCLLFFLMSTVFSR